MSIPAKEKEKMSNDPFYKVCCLTGRNDEKIDWHHAMRFGGKNVQEAFAIVPITESIHKYHRGITTEVNDQIMHVVLNRATDDQLRKYSKAIDYFKERDRLNKKYN